jgi:hypothetical protein
MKESDLDSFSDPSIVRNNLQTTQNIEEVREQIRKLFEAGVRPVVSVPAEYVDTIATRGIEEHPTWIPGVALIAGTFGRKPYIPRDEKRVLLEIELDDPEKIKPRLTGPSGAFQGVVVLDGPIPPERIRKMA